MRVPDEVRKAVAFIGYEDKRNGAFAPKGTFFFLGRDPQPGENFSRTVFAVTARHVIEGMRRKAVEETVLRLNPRAEGADLIMHPIPLHNWFVHPTEENIDVAITEVGVTVAQDHKVIPMSLCATDAFFEQNEVELGEEVFVSGLFRHHYGNSRNIPIVRVGNLAALNEENISSGTVDQMEAYLIEVKSTGGLSGSPVFLNLGSYRSIKGRLQQATGARTLIALLGLMHGHFISQRPQSEEEAEGVHKNNIVEPINAGIAIVVPVKNVLALIDRYETA